MSFTIENEKQNRMSFLDEQSISEDKKIMPPFYTTVYTQFSSILSSTFKFGAVYIVA